MPVLLLFVIGFVELESLKGDRVGTYSIRINDQYRLCFRWSDTAFPPTPPCVWRGISAGMRGHG